MPIVVIIPRAFGCVREHDRQLATLGRETARALRTQLWPLFRCPTNERMAADRLRLTGRLFGREASRLELRRHTIGARPDVRKVRTSPAGDREGERMNAVLSRST